VSSAPHSTSAARRRTDAAAVVGLDASADAVRHALAVGLLDEAHAENLYYSRRS
jgi:hypothetical protein